MTPVTAEVVALGATSAEHQPRPGRWRVMLDPAGYPFCLSSMG
ncbi:MAG: VOC family protein [Pseudonocardiaceae bacterium]